MNSVSGEERFQDANDRLIGALLEEAYGLNRAAHTARVDRLMGVIHAGGESEAEVSTIQKTKGMALGWRRIASVMIAASLLLSAAIWWQSQGASNQAYAQVQKTLERVGESQVRHYQFKSQGYRPIWKESSTEGDLYVKGGESLAIRFPDLLSTGEYWVGHDREQHWLVPPLGPVLVGGRGEIDQQLDGESFWALPYLNLNTTLVRFGDSYELRVEGSETLVGNSGESIRCLHIVGRRRAEAAQAWPATIELWTDQETDEARRIAMVWDLPPQTYGVQRIDVELVDVPELSENWFSHQSHHEGRVVVPMPVLLP